MMLWLRVRRFHAGWDYKYEYFKFCKKTHVLLLYYNITYSIFIKTDKLQKNQAIKYEIHTDTFPFIIYNHSKEYHYLSVDFRQEKDKNNRKGGQSIVFIATKNLKSRVHYNNLPYVIRLGDKKYWLLISERQDGLDGIEMGWIYKQVIAILEISQHAIAIYLKQDLFSTQGRS